MQRRRRKAKAILNGQQYDTNDNFIASLLKKLMQFQIFQNLLNACEIEMLEKGENPLLLNKKKLILNISFSDSTDIANEENTNNSMEGIRNGNE
ncbi:MAG: hypothetical protein LBC75_11350 [Fibromonadaceae bacterium]|jgi:hypothetical protein|nr:hypothetical protein [Fibromonadaceae bacterium]